MILFLLFLRDLPIIDVYSSTISLRSIRNYYDTTGGIQIDILYFPYFIIFTEIPKGSILYEYTSSEKDSFSLNNTFNIDDLNLYRYLEFPYGRHIIEIKEPGNVSFTFGSIQDMCETGIFFTNSAHAVITLDQNAKGGNKIKPYEDKCVVFVNPSSHFHMLQLIGVNARLVLYQKGVPHLEYSGSLIKYLNVDATQYPPIFRFYSYGEPQSQTVNIQIEAKEYKPYKELTVFFNPLDNDHCSGVPKCSLCHILHLDIIVIAIAALIGLIIFLSFTYWVITRICLYKYVSINENHSWHGAHEKGQNRTEPTGRFLMNPILRAST